MHNSTMTEQFAGVSDWETGLPSSDDITPLSQLLIPPELASAFKISPEASRTMLDVDRASQNTLSSLRSGSDFDGEDQLMAAEEEGEGGGGSDSKKSRRSDDVVEDSAIDDQSAGKKRPRLVWTPQLHKRFVEVVAHLGLKSAVPKTIMQMMNVEGLTRENVASHLQKYRLYVKRMQGLSNDGPSPSDHLFASTPPEPSSSGSHGNGNHVGVMPYPPPPPQVMAMGNVSSGGGYEAGNANYHHYHHHHHHHYQQQYSNMGQQQQRDWSGSKYNSTYSNQVSQNNQ